jgi:hypothetical protein
MADRLSELSASNALLGAALTELRTTRISNATADALVRVSVTDAEFAEFLDLAARDAPPTSVFGLALSLPEYIDRRRAGHEALDYLLTHGNMRDGMIDQVASRMTGVTTPDAVVWCHQRLTTIIRRDNNYYLFLKRHITLVADRCRDEMFAYLLSPNRGPARGNVDSFDLAVRAVDDPGPFFVRWQEWIWDGLFDPDGGPGADHAGVHYQILNQRWGEPVFLGLRQTTHDYVIALLRSQEKRAIGTHHLASMIFQSYLGAGDLIQHVPVAELLLREALVAREAAIGNPALRPHADKLRYEVLSVTKTL